MRISDWSSDVCSSDLLLAGLLLTAPLAVAPVLAQEEPAAGEAETGPDGEAESARPAPPGRTVLPLPRFVTLRADEVNLRTGPGTRYPIDRVYQRSGMQVEIIEQFYTRRRLPDWQGSEGRGHAAMGQGKIGKIGRA